MLDPSQIVVKPFKSFKILKVSAKRIYIYCPSLAKRLLKHHYPIPQCMDATVQ